MTKKTFDKRMNTSRIASEVEEWFAQQDFDVQSQESEGSYLIQAKKSSLIRTALGGSRALTVVISRTSSGLAVEVTSGQWVQNLGAVGVGTLLTGGLSLVGSGMAASWTKKIESDVWQYIDRQILFAETDEYPEDAEDKTCPYCAEKIKAKAIICRFCKSDLAIEQA